MTSNIATDKAVLRFHEESCDYGDGPLFECPDKRKHKADVDDIVYVYLKEALKEATLKDFTDWAEGLPRSEDIRYSMPRWGDNMSVFKAGWHAAHAALREGRS